MAGWSMALLAMKKPYENPSGVTLRAFLVAMLLPPYSLCILLPSVGSTGATGKSALKRPHSSVFLVYGSPRWFGSNDMRQGGRPPSFSMRPTGFSKAQTAGLKYSIVRKVWCTSLTLETVRPSASFAAKWRAPETAKSVHGVAARMAWISRPSKSPNQSPKNWDEKLLTSPTTASS